MLEEDVLLGFKESDGLGEDVDVLDWVAVFVDVSVFALVRLCNLDCVMNPEGIEVLVDVVVFVEVFDEVPDNVGMANVTSNILAPISRSYPDEMDNAPNSKSFIKLICR